MDAAILIRPVGRDERAAWEPLWTGYLDFYQTKLPKEIYDVTWRRLHDPLEPMGLIGAYVDGRLLGIVHYLFHRSCWSEGNYCYLQDLSVAEEARKHGLGRALIEATEQVARDAGASRLYWLTHESNSTARALYDRMADRPGHIQYRKIL